MPKTPDVSNPRGSKWNASGRAESFERLEAAALFAAWGEEMAQSYIKDDWVYAFEYVLLYNEKW